ncbi:MAG: hypothetical protein ABR500_00790 [Dermatophilaceae bacterium]|nr:hypothetical protein [Intrasporangiaceae bacterium]
MSSRPAAVPHADEHPPPRRSLGCLLGALVVSGIVVAGAYAGAQWFRSGMDLGGEVCRATASGTTVSFSPEQMDNAATIVGIGLGRGLPARAGTIAIATAIQESKLRNINYGDRDSLGLFQQRPSQGWGTPEQILDPVYSTNAFFDALVTVDGYQERAVTEVAQEVQRSAFPEAYADHETEGGVIASTLAGHTQASLVCRLDAPTTHTEVDDLVAELQSRLGVTATVSEDSTLVVQAPSDQTAWSVGQYLVAKSDRHALTEVRVGDQVWSRSSGRAALQWENADDAGAAARVVATLTPSGS